MSEVGSGGGVMSEVPHVPPLPGSWGVVMSEVPLYLHLHLSRTCLRSPAVVLGTPLVCICAYVPFLTFVCARCTDDTSSHPVRWRLFWLQGYLAHTKLPPPLGPYSRTTCMPKALWWSLGGVGVFYERGTPVVLLCRLLPCPTTIRLQCTTTKTTGLPRSEETPTPLGPP